MQQNYISQQLLKSRLDVRVYKTKIEKQNTTEYISYLRIFTLWENTTNFMLGVLFLLFLSLLSDSVAIESLKYNSSSDNSCL